MEVKDVDVPLVKALVSLKAKEGIFDEGWLKEKRERVEGWRGFAQQEEADGESSGN